MFDLNDLKRLPRGIKTRWASPENWDAGRGAGGQANAGRKGSPAFDLQPGETRTLAHSQGASGVVRRMWFTLARRDPVMLRALRLRMYWDGCEAPAVDCPFGDFFGIGLGLSTTFQNALFSNPEGRSFNCVIPMPFRSGMRITLTYESASEHDTPVTVYYDLDFTLGDRWEADTAYFHVFWNRENPTQPKRDLRILPRVTGRGRFLGCNVGVRTDRQAYGKSWWGEGEVKAYLDGDTDWPTLCGTGAEDYPGSAWGFSGSAQMLQGCPICDPARGLFSFYRFHIPDPVVFESDCLVTIQQIGGGAPDDWQHMIDAGTQLIDTKGNPVDLQVLHDNQWYLLYERSDDWCATAYFYLDRPENNLPELAPLSERLVDLIDVGETAARLDA